MGYSLQAARKTREGDQHPDRDEQFRYLSERVAEHLRTGEPVVSVDAKKKELVGRKANSGREWQPKGDPVEVDTHDFPDPEVGKAIPSPTGCTTSAPTRRGRQQASSVRSWRCSTRSTRSTSSGSPTGFGPDAASTMRWTRSRSGH